MSKIPQGDWNAIAARYQNGESISKIARSYGCTPPAIHYILKRSGGRLLPEAAVLASPREAPIAAIAARTPAFERVAAASSADKPARMTLSTGSSSLVRASAPATAPLGQPIAPGRPDAERGSGEPERKTVPPTATPGLDSELHNRAEAAIATFRSSFDAALVEGSPTVRDRLRQAASDLMRVAARTTMVLDRVNASTQPSSRLQNYPRSAHGPDDNGRLGPA
jgi:transposase-like protein